MLHRLKGEANAEWSVPCDYSWRQEDQRQIVLLILEYIRQRKNRMHEHALGWLIGHSIGMPYFDELLTDPEQVFRVIFVANYRVGEVFKS